VPLAGADRGNLCLVSVTVELPDELADRLATAAAGRGETLEQLAVETLEATFPRIRG
jgi:predicted transcriptional regulator